MSKTDSEKHHHHIVTDVTTVLQETDLPLDYDALGEDEKRLVTLGYKQEFRREFDWWTVFCVSFCILGLLPSVAETLFFGMGCE